METKGDSDVDTVACREEKNVISESVREWRSVTKSRGEKRHLPTHCHQSCFYEGRAVLENWLVVSFCIYIFISVEETKFFVACWSLYHG